MNKKTYSKEQIEADIRSQGGILSVTQTTLIMLIDLKDTIARVEAQLCDDHYNNAGLIDDESAKTIIKASSTCNREIEFIIGIDTDSFNNKRLLEVLKKYKTN